jgi:hypothetical protein
VFGDGFAAFVPGERYQHDSGDDANNNANNNADARGSQRYQRIEQQH